MAGIRGTGELLAFIAGGGQPKYLMFWGHQPPPRGSGVGVGRGCLSQWWPVTFSADDVTYGSPRDRVWGIGLAADDDRAQSPQQWLGLNLLGFALMETRRKLREPGQVR